ncbi:MAG: hypothetical protein WAM09_10325 [Anaerolineales bacterium]
MRDRISAFTQQRQMWEKTCWWSMTMPATPIIHLDLPPRSFQPACAITNDVINFGWEYVVHCHILGYEENNMMRAQLLASPPDPVTNVFAIRQGSGNSQTVLITLAEGLFNETSFTVPTILAVNRTIAWRPITSGLIVAVVVCLVFLIFMLGRKPARE